MSAYRRYEIRTRPVPNAPGHPPRFQVRVSRSRLAALLIKELIHYRADMPVVLSRPCVYGVFSGPVGGFVPRQEKCVGCLRCTVQYPDMVRVEPNPGRLALGDSYVSPDQVDTILYEASTGRVPVRGAGYRGAFGGVGWDGMWTDMSEIVRPTRDGIHGREYISTTVDLGHKPPFLTLDGDGVPAESLAGVISLPVPYLFDFPPDSARLPRVMRAIQGAAKAVETLALVRLEHVLREPGDPATVAPVVTPEQIDELRRLIAAPRMLELDGWDEAAFRALADLYPETTLAVRAPFGADVVTLVQAGAYTLHLIADYHGNTSNGFVLDAIRKAHETLVAAGLREQATLIGSGGIVAAEHVPKAIIAGLDAVALDIPLLLALQAQFHGECLASDQAPIEFPPFEIEWGAQRVINLAASWRDQLLEILGAMGMREVRRLRGEVGRAMFQADLEQEAFAGIEGVEAL